MKKFIAIFLTVVVLCSAVLCVSAQEEMEVITWDSFSEQAAEVDPDAGFYQIGDLNLKMWIPSVFSEQELTEEDYADGYLSVLTTADESAEIIFTVEDTEGVNDLEIWMEAFKELGYEDTEIGVINGIQALTYSDSERDTGNVCYLLLDSDQIMQITFWPISDEGFASVAYLMISSIQAME